MKNILHIEASPRGDRSSSSPVARDYIHGLGEAIGSMTIDRMNIWDLELPHLDGAALEAKYATLRGVNLSSAQRQAWDGIRAQVARIDRADAIVISTPMWNFGIPYRLKHLIDIVTQPGLSFSFNPDTGYSPLLRDRPTTVILASAGDYRLGTSFGRPDLASTYLVAALGFIGLADVSIVPIAPTMGSPEAVEGGKARFADQLRDILPIHAEALR